MDIPNFLYYVTVKLADGTIESPHYMIFENMADGATMVREHYEKKMRRIDSIIMKELFYMDSVILPEETQILIPHNDFGIYDELKSPEEQQHMVELAEMDDPEEAIMGILPDEQEDDSLLCRAFFMGPFVKALSKEEYVEALKHDPFETTLGVDLIWLYQPTGEEHEVSLQK